MLCKSCLESYEPDQLKTMICGCIRCRACIIALENCCPCCDVTIQQSELWVAQDDAVPSLQTDEAFLQARRSAFMFRDELRDKLNVALQKKAELENALIEDLEQFQREAIRVQEVIVKQYDEEFDKIHAAEKKLEAQIDQIDIRADLERAPEGEVAFLTKLLDSAKTYYPQPAVFRITHRLEVETQRSALTVIKGRTPREPGVDYLVTESGRVYHWESKRRVRQLILDGIMVIEFPKSAPRVSFHSTEPDGDCFTQAGKYYLVKDYEWSGPVARQAWYGDPYKTNTNGHCYIPKRFDKGKHVWGSSKLTYTADEIVFFTF